jgi:hypothetical protein
MEPSQGERGGRKKERKKERKKGERKRKRIEASWRASHAEGTEPHHVRKCDSGGVTRITWQGVCHGGV